MSIKHLMPVSNTSVISSTSVITEEPGVYQQAKQPEPLRFQTGHSRRTTTSTAAGLEDSPSGRLSISLRSRHERIRRAKIEDAKQPDPATTDDSSKPSATQSSSPVPAGNRAQTVKQVVATTNPTTPTKPVTLADDAANPNARPTTATQTNSTVNSSPKTPAVVAIDTNTAPITNVSPTNSRASVNPNPTAAKSAAPLGVPLTVTPETSRGGTTKDKSTLPGTAAVGKPSIQTVTSPPTAPAATITPNIHTESPKVEKVPDSPLKGNTGQLTSIAVGVACAASLVIFAILVVICKIRVSRKRARQQERYGDDLFGSHERPSFSDSDGSRKSLFVVPRPFGKFSESAQEKPLGNTHLTGIGTHGLPPTQSLDDSSRKYPPAPLNMQSSSYTNIPPRPPRSPLRPQATHKPEAYHNPHGYSATNSYTPDTQSIYSTNTAKGKAAAPELYGHPSHEYNYAMEYLDHHYPDSNVDSTYQSNHHQGEMIGMGFMPVEDRPYDSRYTVDRNGILNNYTPSISTAARESDYYYKKRVP